MRRRRYLPILIPIAIAILIFSCRYWRNSGRSFRAPAQLTEEDRLLDEVEKLLDVMTLEAGARVISSPPNSSSWDAAALIDDQRDRSWSSSPNSQPPFVFVIELDQVYHLKVLRFDNDASEAGQRGASAHEIRVEASVTSAAEGFSEILQKQLLPLRRRQIFAVDADARWVRLTILSNYGNRSSTELSDFKAYGFPRTAQNRQFDLTGDWKTNYGNVEFLQTGDTVRGCYHTFLAGAGTIDGRLVGRKLFFHFAEESSAIGAGMMTVDAEGEKLSGVWSYMNDKYYRDQWYATRLTKEPGKCRGEFSIEEVIDRAWKSYRRVYAWSIRGPAGTGRIDEASLPSVARLAAILKAERDLQVTLRVHCDESANEEENLKVSNLRAAEVKRLLVDGHGIAPNRIDAYGVGDSDPIVPQQQKWNRLLALQNNFVEMADIHTHRTSKLIPE